MGAVLDEMNGAGLLSASGPAAALKPRFSALPPQNPDIRKSGMAGSYGVLSGLAGKDFMAVEKKKQNCAKQQIMFLKFVRNFT